MGYLAYVVDTQVGEQTSVIDVPDVRGFDGVFPEEFLGAPPERQVEFRIDLVPGTSPIGKVSYCLAPPEMQKLSSQHQELLGKQFIKLGNSLCRRYCSSRRRIVHTRCTLIMEVEKVNSE